LAAYHATALPQPAKKFHIFHKRHFRKTANFQESTAPTEYSMVATAHSQQDPGVMRKAIRQSVNSVSRQTNSKVTTRDLWITRDSLNLIQTFPWNFGINMQKPKDIAARGAAASVHLYCSITLAHHELIAKTPREISSAIRASTVRDNNLRLGRSVAQMLKKRTYE
jgi:hypothetical protein